MLVASLVSIVTVLTLLALYSVYDIKTRRVPNRLTLAGLIIGFLVASITGHIMVNIELHIVSLVFMMGVSLVLFRIGAIGGADYKAFIMISITSPGFELFSLGNQLLEGIIVSGFEILLTLLGGAMVSRHRAGNQKQDKTIALIPVLLCVYMAIQLFGLAFSIIGTNLQ